VQQAERQPERAASGPSRVAQPGAIVVRSRPDLNAVLVPPDQVAATARRSRSSRPSGSSASAANNCAHTSPHAPRSNASRARSLASITASVSPTRGHLGPDAGPSTANGGARSVAPGVGENGAVAEHGDGTIVAHRDHGGERVVVAVAPGGRVARAPE